VIKSNPCKTCQSTWHTKAFCPQNRTPLKQSTKRIKKQSTKELEYQEWKEGVARSYVIARDGNKCRCCWRPAHLGEKLDLNHIDSKGSAPSKKRDLENLELLCRWPCHRNYTDGKECLHA